VSADELTKIAGEQLGLRVDDRDRVQRLADRMPELATRSDAPRVLASELTTGETYFFRHEEQCAAFSDIVPRNAKLLSAACSSGEEPYTLAMLCRDAIAIDAFDLNPVAIERARRGEYGKWSLRTTPEDARRRWFTVRGDTFQIAQELRDAVSFRVDNLVSYAWPAGYYDVIFCRNALMYLTPAALERALDGLSRALAPGGHLFLGHAESLSASHHAELTVCEAHGAFFYKKTGVPSARASGSWVAAIGESTGRANAILAAAPPPIARVERDRVRELIAAERFQEALDAGPDAELRAVVLIHLGRLAEAEEACQALGETASAHYLLATCRESTGDLAGALDEARAAAALDPRFALARLRIGLLARRTGDAVLARAALASAIALLPDEEATRLALFGGGFGRRALEDLARAELGALA
jgi:chemotaxis protein methyltransferase CheR